MKNIIITTLLLLTTTTVTYAQKVKIKKNTIYINKKEFAKVEEDRPIPYSFYINDLKGNHLLYFKWILFEYNEIINGILTERSFDYFEVYKANDLENILYETKGVINYKQFIIKNLYNANALVKDGTNEDKLNEFAIKMGKDFSRLRKEIRN